MDIRNFFGAKPKVKTNTTPESNNNNKEKGKNLGANAKSKKPPVKNTSAGESDKQIESETKKKNRKSSSKDEVINKQPKSVTSHKTIHAAASRSKSTKKDKKKVLIEFDNDKVQIESDNSDFEVNKQTSTEQKNEVTSEDDSPIKATKNKSKDKVKAMISSEDEDKDGSSKKKKQKKKPIMFDSDSDAEYQVPSAKKAKKRRKSYFSDSDQEHQATIEDAFSKVKPKSRNDSKISVQANTKSSPPKKKISAADFFGVDSVKRVEKKSVKRKAEDNFEDDFEIHDDEDFEKTLAELDDQQPSKKVRVEDTPSPKGKGKSLASKLSAKVQENKEKNNEISKSKLESPQKISLKKTTPVKSENALKKTPEKKSSDKKLAPKDGSPQDKPELHHKGSGYRSYLHRTGPQALGSKEIPEGGENCLEGLTFVITGVLESMERDEAKSLLEKYGGKVTGSISKKTTYVVLGRDAGESKVAKARQFGTKEIDEDGMLDLIRTLPGKKSKYEIDAEKQAKKKSPEKETNQATTTAKPQPSQNFQQFANTPKTKSQFSGSITTKSAATSPSISPKSSITVHAATQEHTLLWVDKYKPTSLKQIIGQQGDKSNARKLLIWLQNWHKNRTLGKKPAFNRFNDDGSGHRAALLSGPPGVGKTTTSVIVCQEANFSFVELNASDTRSKKSLKTEVAEALGNHTLVDFFGSKSETKSDGHSHCIIMDEVDGMAGNEDRGGMQELIQLIKTTKIPIICMCNDRNHPKVRSLSNYCFDLRFQRPRVEQIKSAMMSIAFKEGVKIPPPALNEIINAANQDVRQVLHNLSMWTSKEKNISYDQVKKDAASAKKDLKMGPFDVVRKVFVGGEETAHMTIHDKSDLFFQDYSFGPLFVQENYLSVTPYAAKGSVAKHLECITRVADSLTDGDLIDRHIRSGQNWSLLPTQAMFASVIPGDTMRGSMGGMVQFPQWLGKNSTTNKNDRLLQELKTHMCLKVCTDKRGLNLEYLPHLRKVLTEPLIKEGTDGVRKVVDFMDEYDLLREDFDSILEVSQWSGCKDPMSQVETKTKSAFTRAYNKEAHLTPYSTATTAKKSKGKKGAGAESVEGEAGMENEIQDMSSEEEEDPLKDGMIKAKKSKTTKKNVGKDTKEKKNVKGKASVSKGIKKKK